MKKIIICILFAIVATSTFAQEKGKTRLGFDLGYYNKAGLGVDINFLYNIQDNMNVGVRTGAAFVGRESQVEKEYFDAGITNLLGTYNYYFRFKNPSAIFVGGGLGCYKLSKFSHDEIHIREYASNKFGGSLTTGIEIRKFRLALEYNFIPSSSVVVNTQIASGGVLGGVILVDDKVKNNYLAITAGFFIGGGKWK